MKLIGIVTMFIVTTVLVCIFSKTVAVPSTTSINIHAFIDNDLGTTYESTANAIVSNADRKLNYLQFTTFYLQFRATTRHDHTSGNNWKENMIDTNFLSGTDLFVFFTTDKGSSAHSNLKGKICYRQRDFRTMTLPGGDSDKATRDLVVFIGQLLGMNYDKAGRTAKDGTTSCGMGNMVLQETKLIEENKGNNVTGKWNDCNLEEAEDFYKRQMANEPRGFCLEMDLTITRIDIDIHAFYDKTFDALYSTPQTPKAAIENTIEKAESMLNDGWIMRTIFELKVVHQKYLGIFPNDLAAMATIAKTSGAPGANIYVFFTNKLTESETSSELEGKICSGDRAHRTVSLTQKGFSNIGIAGQLAHYIGRMLGMDIDGTHKGNSNCKSGYMGFLSKTTANTWQDIYAFFNQDKQWNQCNVDDLMSFYRQFFRSDNPGQEWEKICFDKRKMTINIHAFIDNDLGNTYDSTAKTIVGDAETKLNELLDVRTAFELQFRTTTLHDHTTKTDWKANMINKNLLSGTDLFVFFTTDKGSSAHSNLKGKICNSQSDKRTMTLPGRDSNKATRDLVVFIGQLLGMNYDKAGRTAKDGITSCGLGNMVLEKTKLTEEGKGNSVTEDWNKCNEEELIANLAQRLCLDKTRIITIMAAYSPESKKLFKTSLNAQIVRSVLAAEDILNQDGALGTVFQLVPYILATPLPDQPWVVYARNWLGVRDKNVYIYFDATKKNTPSAMNICTTVQLFKTVRVHLQHSTSTQVAYHIGRMIGMDGGQTASDGTTCPRGFLATKRKSADPWTKCDIEDVWSYYYKIVAKTGSFCLDSP